MSKPDPFMIDDENPEWTEETFAKARPAAEVLGEDKVAALTARQRGRPRKANPKARVTMRLDADVVAYYRELGPGWQTRMNEALRETMRRSKQAGR